ncbi:MAG: ABC-2 transporter permease [Christensenellaceae bacterium]|nr:ABC-2 transporter permease [Christensenellaceae bacterium]
MKALIYKDIVSIKKSLRTLALMLIIIGIVFFGGGLIRVFPLSFMYVSIILTGFFFGKDAAYNVEQYIIPAPIKRSEIVLSRYAILWAISGLGTLLALIIHLFDRGGALSIPWYVVLPGNFLLISLISSIQLPALYKFGVEKGRVIYTLTYILLFSGVSYLGKNKELLLNIVETISNTNTVLLGAILALLAILINAASYAISVHIYSSKEF